MANFLTAVAFVLGNEGSSFVQHQSDHGGATRWGITRATLAKARGVATTNELAIDEVVKLTLDEARTIYRTMYWQPIKGDYIFNQANATALLDGSVLCGPQRAIRFAQDALGVSADGILGPKTLAALNEASPGAYLTRYIGNLTTHLSRTAQMDAQHVFLSGWLRRASKVALLVI